MRIRRDRVLIALIGLLSVGLALRVWLTLVWSPAITGYSDSGIYFQDSVQSIWTDPIRTQGYTMFLRVLHFISPHLILVTIVQHGLGLVAAVLIFAAVRRCGGPRWLGLVPAAVIALGGDQIFIEHAALSDSLFVFLTVALLYCAVRARQGRLWWAGLAGLCAGLGMWDRGAAMGLIAVVVLWLLFSAGHPTRRTVTAAAVSLVVALAAIGVYVGWRQAASDMPGLLTANNSWNLYARVAPWADCTKFTPPPGTGGLCETTPPSQRGYRSGESYIYNPQSPAQLLFGPPYVVSSYPRAVQLMESWSLAALRGQPLDYLNAVWLDTLRLLDPSHPSYGDLSANSLIAFMLYGPDNRSGKNEFVEYWQGLLYPHESPVDHGDIGPLKQWEEITRVDGVWMAILLALVLAGPWLLAGRVQAVAPYARSGMALFGGTALMLLFFPIVVKGYDYRFVIPAFAPLTAAGAMSAWGLALRIRAIQRGARPLREAEDASVARLGMPE